MQAELVENFAVVAEGHGHGDPAADLRLIGRDALLPLGHAFAKEIGFDGGEVMEPPGGMSDHFDKMDFDLALRLAVFKIFLSVVLVGGRVALGGEGSKFKAKDVERR